MKTQGFYYPGPIPCACSRPARLAMLEHLGDGMVCYAQVAGMQELAAIKFRPDTALPPTGPSICLAVPACHAHLFDERGFAFDQPTQI